MLWSQLAWPLNPRLETAQITAKHSFAFHTQLRVNVNAPPDRTLAVSSTVCVKRRQRRRRGGKHTHTKKKKTQEVLLYSAVHGLATTSRQLRAVGGSALLCSALLAVRGYFHLVLPQPQPSLLLPYRMIPAESCRDRMFVEVG